MRDQVGQQPTEPFTDGWNAPGAAPWAYQPEPALKKWIEGQLNRKFDETLLELEGQHQTNQERLNAQVNKIVRKKLYQTEKREISRSR